MAGLMRVVLVLLGLLWANLASAQMVLSTGNNETPSPTLSSPEDVRDVVSRMSDAEVRDLLLERLDAVAAQQNADAQIGLTAIEWTTRAGAAVGASLADVILSLPELPRLVGLGLRNFYEPRGFEGLMGFFWWLAVALLVGAIAEILFRRVTGRWQRMEARSEALKDTLVALTRRFVLDAAGLAVFFLGAGAVINNLVPPDTYHPVKPNTDRELAWLILTVPVFYARVASMIIRFLQAPNSPHLRLMNADDRMARFVHFHGTIIGALWGITGLSIIFLASHGVAIGESRLGFWLNLLLYSWGVWMFFVARKDWVKMAAGAFPEENTPLEARVARAYPWFAIFMTVSIWLLIEYLFSQGRFDLLDGRQNETLALLLFAPTYDTAIRGLVRHLVPPMKGEGVVAARAHLITMRSYVRIGRIIVFGWLIWTISGLWDLDFRNVAAAGVGARAAVNAVEFLLIVAVGYLVWELTTLWINRKLAAEQTALGFDINDDEPGGGEGGGAGGSRLSTVLPLILLVLQSAIVVITLLLALGEAGLDTTPLLAGAGIVGLAVGFGAQKLVADVVGGVFFLIDDAFRTGEYVEVEGTVGTVEKISIRSMQLRHHKGPVHTIPYGEIPKITNYSRDWVIMKLKFTVPFETDPNKVKKLFKQIGKDMQQVPEFAADLLQPFKSQGVFDFDDVGMIIRGKFMAKPGKQFTLRKEIYNRVKKAFAENGIDFARREVRVAIPGLESAEKLTDDQKEAIAVAASEAAQQQDVPPPDKT
ncbi:MAG: mechanosensitive ion channel family protein [Pikeienuella sp.]